MPRNVWLFRIAALALAVVLPEVAVAVGSPTLRASAAGFDCVTKDGEFCRGELGKGNQCVSTTTCTPEQLAECLPGFPMCPTVEPSPDPEPFPQH